VAIILAEELSSLDGVPSTGVDALAGALLAMKQRNGNPLRPHPPFRVRFWAANIGDQSRFQPDAKRAFATALGRISSGQRSCA
jgi:hypothetical protein